MADMRLLQSGFIAYPKSDLGKVAEGTTNFHTAVLTRNVTVLDTDNWYDVEIDELKRRLVDGSRAITSFEFREAIIKKALEVFGNPAPFTEWFSLQRFSPGVTYMHRRYLLETLRFVFDGVPRKMSHTTYKEVLFCGADVSAHVAADDESEFVELFDKLNELPLGDNASLLFKWTSDAVRTHDLLLTMEVIFGMRANKGG